MRYISGVPIFMGMLAILSVVLAPTLAPNHPDWFIASVVAGGGLGCISAALHVGIKSWIDDRRAREKHRKTWWKNGAAKGQVAGYVYFVKAARGRYKIGRTSNVEARINQLQTGNHERLSVELVIPTNEPEEMERAFHRKWDHKRRGGEWFSLSRRDMRWVIGNIERFQRKYTEQLEAT